MSVSIPPIKLPAAPHRGRLRRILAPFVRPVLAVELASCEILLTSLLFSFEADIPAWQHPAYWLRHLELLAIVAGVALAVLAWPRRAAIGELWETTAAGQSWRWPLALNLALFAVLTASTVALTKAAAQTSGGPPWGLFWLYCVPLFGTALSLVWLAAPYAFWRGILTSFAGEIAIATSFGGVLLVLGRMASGGWDRLAGVTLELVYRVLSLYEAWVRVDYERHAVRVGNFTVIIDQSCSGYEGVALVSTFMVLFLWAFRRTLRFPQALLLLPLGIGAILLLNVLRIAALVSLGAHISRDMAAGGFHSQAGWMAFLAVTVGIMVAAPRMAFFSRVTVAPPIPPTQRETQGDGDRLMAGLLLPFMALMAGSMLTAASAPFDIPLYGLKVVAAGAVLWLLRDVWWPLVARPGVIPLAAGIGVGLLWVLTDPFVPSGVGGWLAGQPLWIAYAWLAVRALGGVGVVPLAEEMAFRGLLYRWIVARRFEFVDAGRFSLVAFVVSSALFGVLHQRWLAGAIAGAVFAALMIRKGRLWDAVVGHAAANATIFAWAILMRQWSLL